MNVSSFFFNFQTDWSRLNLVFSFSRYLSVEGGTTDFSVNEDDDEDDDQDMEVEASQTSNNSHHPQSSNVPLLMDTSWITSTDGAGGGQHGEDNPDSERAVKEQKMSDSMLVETGGPLDDDFSELSSSAAAAAAVGVNDDASSSVNNVSSLSSLGENNLSFSNSSGAFEYF